MKQFLATLSLLSLSLHAAADDWPQWRGPNRDGKSAETGFAQWPKEGPKLLWTYKDAGAGYSSVAVVGDVVYSLGGKGSKEEFAFALDAKTGQKLWQTKISDGFKNAWGDGPRGTPTVVNGAVFAISGSGHIACLDAKSGSPRWSKSYRDDLNGKIMPPMDWGFSESPLVDGDQVVCSPGGEDGTLAALDIKTGKVRWRSKDMTDDASYSSMVVNEAGGIRHYVQLTSKNIVGIAAADGKLLWQVAGEGYKVAVIPTPMVSGDHVFATTDYGAKCALVKLSKSAEGIKAEKVYSNKNMENHHGGAILHEGHVYASHGNANQRKALPFVCLKLTDGAKVWSEPKELEPSSLAYADGDFFCFGQQSGALVRVKASSDKYEERGRFTIPAESKKRAAQGGIWNHPTIANGKLYLRDQELIYCYALK